MPVFMLRIKEILACVALFWPVLLPAQAITNRILALNLTNYTGYVINSDALSADPAWNRDALLTTARIATTNTTGSLAFYTFRSAFRLLDTNGVAQTLNLPTGGTGTVLQITNNLIIGAGSTIFTTNLAEVRPASRLSHFNQYRVQLELLSSGGGSLNVLSNDTLRAYFHFTNMVPTDPAMNVLATLQNTAWQTTSAIQTDINHSFFRVTNTIELRRYDSWTNASLNFSNVPVRLTYTLRDDLNNVIPLTTTQTVVNVSVGNLRNVADVPRQPRVQTNTVTAFLRPTVQLDSVNRTYRLTTTLTHTNQAGQPALLGNTLSNSLQRLLDFNGNLGFGAIDTYFTSVASDPPFLGVAAGTVISQLTVDNLSGEILGQPGYNYGDGSALNVRLQSNGDAFLSSGSAAVVGPTPDQNTYAGVRVDRSGMVLNTLGLFSNLKVWLPTGMGWRANTNRIFLNGTLDFANAELNQFLDPVLTSFTYAPGPAFFVAEESKALWFEVGALTWTVANGRFTTAPTGSQAHYVRQDEFAYLASVAGFLSSSSMADKRSNERYFQHLVAGLTLPLQVDTAPSGTALASFTANFGPGSFRTHFPYNSLLTWTAGGSLAVALDVVATGPGSTLGNFSTVGVRYSRNCDGCAAATGDLTVSMAPDAGRLSFTRDAGLVGQGPVTANGNLEWGYYFVNAITNGFAQRMSAFSTGRYHMSGVFLVGGDNALDLKERASVLLLSGMTATNLTRYERADVNGSGNATRYKQGFADYAGMNFTVGSSSMTATSHLATVPCGPWTPTGRSKYYLRQAGVSGIHEAVNGTFPSTATLYGYTVNFDQYGLSYLDSRVHESRTDGGIVLPAPSDFTQKFQELKFTCPGGLASAKVPDTDGYKELAYWRADFKTLAISFQSNSGECDPSTAYLVLGVQGHATHIAQTLYGSLGFLPTGNLISKSFGLNGVDSRLKLPAVTTLAGPAGTKYSFTPVADAYYNHYPDFPTASEGWVNLAGKLDVPFFEDLKVHVHTSGDKDSSSAPLYLMGGWQRKSGVGVNHGWQIAGQDFFTAAYFDDTNRGFPTGPTRDGYRNNPASDQYHVRAQRSWLDIVEFDYPLQWSTVTKSFKSWQPITNDLVVINVSHEILYLDPKNAEIKFGVQYEGIPQINITEMAFNAIDEATGALKALTDTIGDAAVGRLTAGLDRFTDALNANLSAFMEPVFERTLDPVVDHIYGTLYTNRQTFLAMDYKQWVTNQASQVLNELIEGIGASQPLNTVKGALTNLSSYSGGALGVLYEVDDTLEKVQDTLTEAQNLISKDGSGNRQLASTLVKKLVDNYFAALAASLVDQKLNELFKQADPTLDQIYAVLDEVNDTVAQLRSQLGGVTGIAAEINARINSAAGQLEINNLTAQVNAEIYDFLLKIDPQVDDPFFTYSPDELKQLVRQEVLDRFFATQISAAITQTLKERIYDLDAYLREAVDTALAQVNSVLKETVSETLEEVDKKINGLLGEVNRVIGAAQIDGYAHISGDSLKLLRLDLLASIKLTEEMQLKAYFQIKELDSENSGGCYDDIPGKATEVSMGATDVDLKWISDGLRGSVGMKFVMQTSPFKVLGVGGSFEITGGLKFQSLEVTYLGAAMMLGKKEFYLSAAAGMKFNSYAGFGGIYFGKTCTLDPIQLWDPLVASAIGTPPFTGAYGYAEAHVPVSELLGIPATCLFRITAGVGFGAGFFIEGPTLIGKMKLAVSGEALCLISLGAEAVLVGVMQGQDVRFVGQAKFDAKLGPCPICLKFSKTVGLKFDVRPAKWDVDF